MVPELKMSDSEWQAFINDRQGASGRTEARQTIRFHSGPAHHLEESDLQPERGIHHSRCLHRKRRKDPLLSLRVLNELLPDWAKDKAGTFSILANSAEDVPRVAQAIDSIFANTDAPTKTESEREFALSFQTMMGGVKQFLYGIMAAITFSLAL